MAFKRIGGKWLRVAALVSGLGVMAVFAGVIGFDSAAAQQGGFTVTSSLGNTPASYPKTTGIQTGRLFRDGVASNCFFQKATPTILEPATSFVYDQYVFKNQTQQTSCVTITQSASCAGQTFIVAYRNSFNPASPQQNYLGDAGASTASGAARTFAVAVPPFSNLVLVTHEVTSGAGCSFYQIQVSGIPPVQ